MGQDNVTVRGGKRHDCEQILNLTRQMGYSVAGSEFEHRLSTVISDEAQQVFVAENHQGRILGWVHVLVANRLGMPNFAEIGGIFVDGKHRGKGVGRALVARCEGWAQEGRMQLLRVRCNLVREDAPAFYRNLGFEHIKDQMVFDKVLGVSRS